MAVVKEKIDGDFTIVPNKLISDNTLNKTSKLIYIYIASKPDGWEVNNLDIQQQLNIKSRTTVANSWKELMFEGWISRIHSKTVKGGFDYLLHAKKRINVSKFDIVMDGFTDQQQKIFATNEINKNIKKNREKFVMSKKWTPINTKGFILISNDIKKTPMSISKNGQFEFLIKNIKGSHSPKNKSKISPSSFDSFWQLYPKKKKKHTAKKEFGYLCCKTDAPTIEKLLEYLESHKNSELWQNRPDLIPFPSNYIKKQIFLESAEDMIVYGAKKKNLENNKIFSAESAKSLLLQKYWQMGIKSMERTYKKYLEDDIPDKVWINIAFLSEYYKAPSNPDAPSVIGIVNNLCKYAQNNQHWLRDVHEVFNIDSSVFKMAVKEINEYFGYTVIDVDKLA